jgi:hypothetical protein
VHDTQPKLNRNYQNNLNLFISIGGLRKAQVRDKLHFSRKYNRVVLGFDEAILHHADGCSLHDDKELQHDDRESFHDSNSSNIGSEFLSQPLSQPTFSQVQMQTQMQMHAKSVLSHATPSASAFFSQASSSSATRTVSTVSQATSATAPRTYTSFDFSAIAVQLKIKAVRPFQQAALALLNTASNEDQKLIQAPTSVGKDLIPFAMAVHTKKAQLIFVPYVALVSMIFSEGLKYGCRVVKFTDIGKNTTLQTAAATADVIVFSYEHAPRAIRVAQELQLRGRLGWVFWNEAHVAVVDRDFRDFHGLQELARYCPQVCCMTATMQPQFTSVLTSVLGRSPFSRSMLLSPKRDSVTIGIKISSDPRICIADELFFQEPNQRAIVFCLFKKNVEDMAKMLRSRLQRVVLDCTSGATADLATFAASDSAVMVCTTVLATGVSFNKVTRIYFLDCAHSPEVFLQGAGRGAREPGETCVATLVTSKQQLDSLKEREGYLGDMAKFCQTCIQSKKDFGHELYRLFEHNNPSDLNGCEESGSTLQGKVNHQQFQIYGGDPKRKLLYSPTPTSTQQEQGNFVCHSASDEHNGTEAVFFKGPNSEQHDLMPQWDGLGHQGYGGQRDQTSTHSQAFKRGRADLSSETDFGKLARAIMASRVKVDVPDFRGRCESK